MLKKENVQDIYPLSLMQEGLLFHSLYDRTSQAYFQQLTYRISGHLDIDVFEASWNELLSRHDTLRTAFVYEQVPQPLQVVLKKRTIEFTYRDLRSLNPEQQTAAWEDYLQKDRQRPFHLTSDALIRVAVLQMEDQRFEIVWSFHHILLDGWCSGIVHEELLTIYQALSRRAKPNLPPVTPFSHYIRWIEKVDQEAAQAYWQNYLTGYDHLATIPKEAASNSAQGYLPARLRIKFDALLTNQLNELAGRAQVTINTLVQSLWGVLLSRYNGVDDVVFGVIVSGRPPDIPAIDRMIGLFMNTIPVRITFTADDTLADLLRRVSRAAISSGPHHYHSLAEIQANHNLKQGLFDHIMVFENYPLESVQVPLSGLTISRAEAFEQTNYDFLIAAFPDQELGFEFNYNGRVYSPDRIQRLAGHLEQLARSAVINLTTPVNRLEMLTNEERHRLLVEFNRTEAAYPRDKTITDLFEAQAARTPNQLALIFEDAQMTYRELNERANYLAQYLMRHQDIQPEERVGLLVDRSGWAVIGLLGILKAGGAYLPLDPSYPEERINYMLRDSGCRVLLTEDKYLPPHRSFSVAQVIDLASLAGRSPDNPVGRITPQNLAYVIYTSGSTGKPKGVMIGHQGFVNMSLDQVREFGVTGSDRVVQFASPCFDASLSEVFMALFAGAALVLISKDTISRPDLFLDYLEKHQISVITFPPIYLASLEGNELGPVKTIITAGEPAIVGDALYYSRTKQYFNAYGPTEMSVCVSFHQVDPDRLYDNRIPIGRPIANTSVFILDESLNLAPQGIPGEICVSGHGLARGYLNQPETTAQKFIDHPFRPGEKLYRSGDLGRWLPDGHLEFLGRKDDQVKIRGFRIELAEIEHTLMQHPDVEAAVVLARSLQGTAAELVAYLACRSEFHVDEMRAYLARFLPDYMVPAYFIHLERIPLTTNGKVDKLSLPDPAAVYSRQHQYVPAGNELEAKLVSIWEEVLGRPKIGIHDNFFDLGGHSIKAIRLVSRIKKDLDVQVELNAVFQALTIHNLARQISNLPPTQSEQTAIPMILFNPNQPRQVFFFPPLPGYGVVYQGLATQLTNYSICSFDFALEEDRLEKYAESICARQPSGPLVLFGYSGGGNLALELARFMSGRGRQVTDILLLDSWRRQGEPKVNRNLDLSEVDYYANLVRDYPPGPHKSDLSPSSTVAGTEIIQQTKAYMSYLTGLNHSGRLNTNIHLITAVHDHQNWEDDSLNQDWSAVTTAEFHSYPGCGHHLDMLKNDHLAHNAGLISGILNEIFEGHKTRNDQNGNCG
ncbi:MAG: amino acid adenylation domain-containing protein [Deltaproteobacteria bacterium]|nr:amino acid adenylation domain-containing protein [Deltaproteobacteria bacterium]